MLNKDKTFKAAKLFAQICGGWWSVMSGAASVPFTVLALYLNGAHAKELCGILAITGLWIMVFKIAWKNYQLLRDGLPCLEIEGITCRIMSNERYPCQLRVSSTKTADNVQVEIQHLEDELGEVGTFIRPSFPKTLKPDIVGANTINPGSSQKYNLFQVIKSDGAKVNGKEQIPHKNFICYFSEETAADVTLFQWKRFYRIKIVATARDLPKAEQDFFVNFSCKDNEFCRFNLIPVTPSTEKEAREINRALVVAELGQFRLDLLSRAQQINKMSSSQYHDADKDGDMVSVRIINEITSYFGRYPIDLGTNALADFQSVQNMDTTPIHDIYGKTIHHDDWQWMQQKLIQSEKNLTKIIDKLNAKPL
jgi:hypothetical protein